MSEYVVELPESGAADECIELHALADRLRAIGGEE